METEDISVWQVQQGKITELLILGDIFVLRDHYNPNLKPLEVAKNFIEVFDVKKTAMIRKIKHVPGTSTNLVHSFKDEDILDRVNKVPILKSHLIGMYRELPDQFTIKHTNEYFVSLYPSLGIASQGNKARAHTQYLKDNDFIQKHRQIGKLVIYTFKKAPFDVTKSIAVAEFDASVAQDQKLRELACIRDN